jgi:glutaryl-CoA dehydrogenase (non-decarboxylating)
VLTVEQERASDEFRAFADEHVRPRAADFDRNERIPRELIEHMAASGFLLAPQQFDLVTYGLLHEQIGAACSSVRSVLTVHGMVTQALAQWGTDEQAAPICSCSSP